MIIDRIEFAQFKAQWIKELFPQFNKSGISIADIGCGDGLMTYYVQEVFYEAEVVGVDKQDVTKKAKEKFPEICFAGLMLKSFDSPGFAKALPGSLRMSGDSYLYSIYSYEMENNNLKNPQKIKKSARPELVEGFERQLLYFDLIIFSLVLHHMPPIEQIACLNYWRQFLKPGGKIIIMEFNPWAQAHWMRKISDVCEGAIAWIYPKTIFKNTYKSYYACFFPKILGILTPFEKYMQKIPLGALVLYEGH